MGTGGIPIRTHPRSAPTLFVWCFGFFCFHSGDRPMFSLGTCRGHAGKWNKVSLFFAMRINEDYLRKRENISSIVLSFCTRVTLWVFWGRTISLFHHEIIYLVAQMFTKLFSWIYQRNITRTFITFSPVQCGNIYYVSVKFTEWLCKKLIQWSLNYLQMFSIWNPASSVENLLKEHF